MKTLTTYLIFKGNCKEAMQFYAHIFNGKITLMQTFKEAPIDFPEELNDRIFNSELKAGDICIKASDDAPPMNEVTIGSHISLFLTFDNQQKQEDTFNQLVEGGKISFPLNNGFGMLKDKFNIQWMLAMEE